MNRRTFLLLTGATSGALLRPPVRRADAAERPTPAGRLRFSLDDTRRWSLWYQAAGAPVPLIEHALLGAWIGERFAALGDLEDTVIGTRRPPGGESLVVRGRGGDLWVEAEFLVAPPDAAPRAAITVTVYPDRSRPPCRGVRFFTLPAAQVLPGAAPLRALTNGYTADDPSRLVRVGDGPRAATSHGTMGFTRGRRALGLVFDPGGPGDARVELDGETLDATSAWHPARPVNPEGDSASLRLCYQNPGDELSTLTTLFAPRSAVDRERLERMPVPTGWAVGADAGSQLSEEEVRAAVEACAARFGRRHFRYVRLDAGYQRALGDWETHGGFPAGHRGVTQQIHAYGLRAALWIAPFAVTASSGIPAAHPQWLLRDEGGPLVVTEHAAWGGPVYGLDGAHPEVQEWLYALARRAVRDWGYDQLTVDGLGWVPHGATHHGGRTDAEAYRHALAAVRDGVDPETFLLAAGGPLQQALGLANGARVAVGVGSSWGDIERGARAAGLRSYYQGGAWTNDPGSVQVGEPLTTAEARTWASVVALSGSAVMGAGDITALLDERVAIVQRTIPGLTHGRPGDALTEERPVAPAFMVGESVVALTGPWRFRTGDDPSYAGPDHADDAWEPIAAPGPWGPGGRPPYDGFAWYRTRVRLPPAGPARSSTQVWLVLGKIDDADETFVNGVRVGGQGAFPPAARSARGAYRRYPVEPGALNWGGENVVAVRVFDGGGGRGGDGGSGEWDARRDRPAGIWVSEGAPRWWTVALINWDAEPRDLSATLADLGIPAGRLHAYDVWRDAPMDDVRGQLTTRLEPHGVLVAGLRPARDRPQIIGTTRHVVQGALDVADEAWDAATHTLRGRAVALDDRAYAVTIAAPGGRRPETCTATRACTLRPATGGHVVLEWPGDAGGRDIEWALRFRADAAP